ncbi:hypothetical protein A8H39_01335 [Paraburkholderia fungorum]|uniref:hypothetical protein n=1 Tax=Paraburkholderia fungorum TaxID=134537 RepID=UPI000480D664|nr:hypothetical protein [Paraburkholderia fungorum]PNE59818.1 hypothetical protein A8H39_01335 [Paraburkholderia fungorum]
MPRIPVSPASIASLRGALTDLIGKENIGRDGPLKYTHLLHSIAAGFGFKDHQQFNHLLGTGAAPADVEFDVPAMFKRLAAFGWDEDNHAAGHATFTLACATPSAFVPDFGQWYVDLHNQLNSAYPYASWDEVNQLVLNGQYPRENLKLDQVPSIAATLDQAGYHPRQLYAPPPRLSDLVRAGSLTQQQALQLEEHLSRGSRIMIAGPIASRPSLLMQTLLLEAATQHSSSQFRFDQTRLEICKLPDNVLHCWTDYRRGETLVIGGHEASGTDCIAVDRFAGEDARQFLLHPGSMACITAAKEEAIPKIRLAIAASAIFSVPGVDYVDQALASIDVTVYLTDEGRGPLTEISVRESD